MWRSPRLCAITLLLRHGAQQWRNFLQSRIVPTQRKIMRHSGKDTEQVMLMHSSLALITRSHNDLPSNIMYALSAVVIFKQENAMQNNSSDFCVQVVQIFSKSINVFSQHAIVSNWFLVIFWEYTLLQIQGNQAGVLTPTSIVIVDLLLTKMFSWLLHILQWCSSSHKQQFDWHDTQTKN